MVSAGGFLGISCMCGWERRKEDWKRRKLRQYGLLGVGCYHIGSRRHGSILLSFFLRFCFENSLFKYWIFFSSTVVCLRKSFLLYHWKKIFFCFCHSPPFPHSLQHLWRVFLGDTFFSSRQNFLCGKKRLDWEKRPPNPTQPPLLLFQGVFLLHYASYRRRGKQELVVVQRPF